MIQRQLTFEQAITICLKEKYCNFSGRASRSEFWWWQLFILIVSVVLNFFAFMLGDTLGDILRIVIGLGFFLPNWGVSFRRLHDINKSAWWLLLLFIPVVGWIILIVWCCKDSDPLPNQYGIVPNLVA